MMFAGRFWAAQKLCQSLGTGESPHYHTAIPGGEMDDFSETSGSLARKCGVLPETIRAYGDAGLIDCKRLESGVRMFRASAAAQVQKILAERLARRGGKRPVATG